MQGGGAAEFVDRVRASGVLDAGQLKELVALARERRDVNELAAELERRGWLTPYQCQQLVHFSGHNLTLGPYLFLAKLGEGGMGQVFKARHRRLDRVVALKLIRKERLENADAVRRFYREIRAASQLSHPNIVHAYDADEIDGTHFFTMEYVDGTNLADLVRAQGPLSVADACACIRQAAVGLQHAHERGLVHRDVKPHNLLLSRTPSLVATGDGPRPADGGVIKILDMGLARTAAAPSEDSSTMTREGVVMGTPDYIAPEQARSSHGVDIRADLYSLGCTFYFLLTGQPPFAGGALTEKLLQHQLEEPIRVDALRPGVPPGVIRIVHKLLAKKPERRYQTPDELATALANVDLDPQPEETSPFASLTLADGPAATPDEAVSDTIVAPGVRRGRGQRIAQDRWIILGIVLGALSALALVIYLVSLLPKPPPPTDDEPVGKSPSKKPVEKKPEGSKASNPEPPPGAPVDDAWIRSVANQAPARQRALVEAKLRELNPDFVESLVDRSPDAEITAVDVTCDHLANLTPLRAFTKLQKLGCWGKGLGDLSPLQGMRLTELVCPNTSVTDLSPLKGMPLTYLNLDNTPVTDLSPLRGLPLKRLHCYGSQVSDLKPLRDCPLEYLVCHLARVTDLSPIKGMPLKELTCDFQPARDLAVLRTVKSLVSINGVPAAEYVKNAETRLARSLALTTQEAKRLQADTAKSLKLPVELTNSIGMKLRFIPAGKFLMGSPSDESGRRDHEGPEHLVTITKPFYLGTCEVTQKECETVLGQNPATCKGPQNPVDAISWKDAVGFCTKLAAMAAEKKVGRVYRLPTEAEWEYARRAGTTTPYSFAGDRGQLADHAWFNENDGGLTHPVGTKKANAWGLFDLHGNLWEFCADYYDAEYYTRSPAVDPRGPEPNPLVVIRGGARGNPWSEARSANRWPNHPPGPHGNVGFRVLLEVP